MGPCYQVNEANAHFKCSLKYVVLILFQIIICVKVVLWPLQDTILPPLSARLIVMSCLFLSSLSASRWLVFKPWPPFAKQRCTLTYLSTRC